MLDISTRFVQPNVFCNKTRLKNEKNEKFVGICRVMPVAIGKSTGYHKNFFYDQ